MNKLTQKQIKQRWAITENLTVLRIWQYRECQYLVERIEEKEVLWYDYQGFYIYALASGIFQVSGHFYCQIYELSVIFGFFDFSLSVWYFYSLGLIKALYLEFKSLSDFFLTMLLRPFYEKKLWKVSDFFKWSVHNISMNLVIIQLPVCWIWDFGGWHLGPVCSGFMLCLCPLFGILHLPCTEM